MIRFQLLFKVTDAYFLELELLVTDQLQQHTSTLTNEDKVGTGKNAQKKLCAFTFLRICLKGKFGVLWFASFAQHQLVERHV